MVFAPLLALLGEAVAADSCHGDEHVLKPDEDAMLG
jgi:hypothetical protein